MSEKLYLEQFDEGNPTQGLSDEQIEELQTLVGEAIFLFNSLETNLDRAIAEVIEDRAHQPGYAITSELNVFAKKIVVFKALYGMGVEAFGNEEFEDEFERLWKLLFQLKDIRNDIAHADWLEASETYEVRLRIATDEKGPYSIRKEMPPSFLEQKITELQNAIDQINSFSEHWDEMRVYGKILTEEDYARGTVDPTPE